MQRAPDNPEVHYYYGLTQLFARRPEAALREFDEAIHIDPDFGQPYYAAYYVLRDQGQQERALAYVERWQGRRPDDAQAMRILQEAHRAAGTSTPTPAPPPLPRLP